ncbi:odorant receptor Or2-like [Phymastichus coffea]|uniref:odorant receptor Or2-like n=1 Tax=Phymastichus coffea TaxID=108790 RepID=UPI00273C5B65|nr:odorant receptor Or2-like [Phymastichus coffea]
MDKISNSIEYRKLPMLFCILTFSGVWCPNDWNLSSKTMYKLYTIVQIISGILFWFAILMNILVGTHSEQIYENLFAISTLSYAIYKDFFVLRNKKLIMTFLQLCFEDEWYIPQDNIERTIIEKYNYETSWITQTYAAGIITALAVKASTPMLKSQTSWALPIPAWCPYRIDNFPNYFAAYVQEILGGVPMICLHIGIDSLFVTLVLQLCTKLAVLKYRMKTTFNSHELEFDIPIKKHHNADKILAKFADKHERILQFANQINSAFQGILTGQVMVTIPNICINVYLLSQHKGGISLNIIDSFMCFGTCLIQIFLFCWYGNKITLHSTDVEDAVYEMNWPTLTVPMQKKLLTIMIRTTRKIKFAAGTFVMNIDSFIEIIKTSYSAFRVLQDT